MKFLFAFFISLNLSAAENRQVQALKAEKALLEVHFFSEGRGMHMVPGFIEGYEKALKAGGPVKSFMHKLLAEKWGLATYKDGRVVGLFKAQHKGRDIGVLGCAGCHAGRALGEVIPGLGNKTVDVGSLGKWGKRGQLFFSTFFRKYSRDPEMKKLKEQALLFTEKLGNPKITNLTQGMVPVSVIRQWFYDQAGVPLPEDLPRGAVKVPSFWGYTQKRKVGAFSDGFGDGAIPGWAVAVELIGGQEPPTIRRYFDRVEKAEHLFGDLLPPKYPRKISTKLADQGRVVFEKTCQKCHGHYDKDAKGFPVYEAPKWKPIRVVKTDRDRLDGNTPLFIDLVQKSPIRDLIRVNPVYREGFFAPKLYAIWSRFPYLHNGSVPSLWALLTPPEDRPKVFSMKDAGEAYRFDEKKMGLEIPESGYERKRLLAKARDEDRSVYWTERVGHSSQGHHFGTKLPSDEKWALIEYLKTL